MGNWHISVEGIGCHHNTAFPQDADKLATAFVQQLHDAGHTITKASFTYGGAQSLFPEVVVNPTTAEHPARRGSLEE